MHQLNASKPRVLVVGAGVAGAGAADVLTRSGVEVLVVDKGRGPGGRASTRREGGFAFDHGAQYFTARDRRFVERLGSLVTDGCVSRWRGRIGELNGGLIEVRGGEAMYVGVPGMNALVKGLLGDVAAHFGRRVVALERVGRAWSAIDEEGGSIGGFDGVVLALPAPQLGELSPSAIVRGSAERAKMSACWAVMVGFEHRSEPGFLDGVKIRSAGPLAWIARNTSKAGRVGGETWVGHASAEWTSSHLEEPREAVAEFLGRQLCGVIGRRVEEVAALNAHRWRYALVIEPLGEACVFDEPANIAACGDWCLGPRIECAFLSGLAAGERVAEALGCGVVGSSRSL